MPPSLVPSSCTAPAHYRCDYRLIATPLQWPIFLLQTSRSRPQNSVAHPARPDRGRGAAAPRVSSRTASSPHSMRPGRSERCARSSSPMASADMRHGIDGEEEEAAVCVEQLAAIGDEGREILLQLPHFAFGAAAEFGRIEQYAVIAPAAPGLARGEFHGIVSDPADWAVAHAGERGRCHGPARPTSWKHRHGRSRHRSPRRPACRRRYSRTG